MWRDLPQTPQAAEFVAFAAALQYISGPTVIDGDCQHVVTQATAPILAARIAPNKRYSGVVRDTLKYPAGLRNLIAVEKVKAHVDPESLSDPRLRQHAIGSGMADELAKSAVARHPRQAIAEEKMLEVTLEDASAIVAFAAEALQHWPPLEKKMSAPRRGAHSTAAARARRPQHDWAYLEGAWRCTKCLRCAVGASDNPSGTRGHCTGYGTDHRAQEAAARGHSVAIAQGDGVPVIFCMRCGAWTARRRRGTAKQCVGTPTPAGKQALYNIARGKHPWLPPGTPDCHRAALTTAGTARTRKRNLSHVTEIDSSPGAADRADEGMLVDDNIPAASSAEAVPQHLAPLTAPTEHDRRIDTDSPADDCDMDFALHIPPSPFPFGPEHFEEEEDVFGHGGSLEQADQRAVEADTLEQLANKRRAVIKMADFRDEAARTDDDTSCRPPRRKTRPADELAQGNMAALPNDVGGDVAPEDAAAKRLRRGSPPGPRGVHHWLDHQPQACLGDRQLPVETPPGPRHSSAVGAGAQFERPGPRLHSFPPRTTPPQAPSLVCPGLTPDTRPTSRDCKSII